MRPSIGYKSLRRVDCGWRNGLELILCELQAVLHYEKSTTYLDRQPKSLFFHATNCVETNFRLGRPMEREVGASAKQESMSCVLLASPMTVYLKAEVSKREVVTPEQASLADLC